MAVDRPDRPARQFGEGSEPVAGAQKPVEDLVGTRGHFRHQCGPPRRVQRIEPGGASERLAAILGGLQEVAAGIAVAEHTLQAGAHELFIAEARGGALMPAIVAQQAQHGLEK
jgi:hypothetical protein